MLRNLMLALMLAFAMPTILTGCGTMGQIQELPLDRRIQLAYDTHAEVTRQVAAALDARQISVSTAKSYLDFAEGSRKALDEARALVSVDLSTAEARIQLARDILTRAQAELIKAGAK